MLNNKRFLLASLIAIMATCPAFSETPATQEWVKANVYSKAKSQALRDDLDRQGDALNTINQRLATDVRDKIYVYDTNKNSPTYRQVLDPLNTDAQTAFSGINEVLEKVDGNNGVAGSAVQLETRAQNAYGAINELNGKVGDLQTSVNGKVSNWDLISNYYTKEQINGIMIDGKLVYTATENGGVTVDNETRQIKLDVDSSNPNVTYVYRNGRWVALDYVSTWNGPASN